MLTRTPALSLVTFSLMALCLACDQPAIPDTPLRPVRFQPVYATGGERVRTFSGVSQASVESRLSFKVAGTVKSIQVKVGDNVNAGDLIAELDATDFQLQVESAQASLESARANLRSAKSSYDRIRQLFENRNASRNDLDAARAAAESAEAQVSALEKQLELAQSQLTYTNLFAPVDGAIASVDADVNENVAAGRSIVQLSSGANLEVDVRIPEILIAQLRTGDRVDVRFDAIPERRFPARVTEVGVSPTGLATTFPVTVLLSDERGQARPGMAAEVAFNFGNGDTRERFLVPSFAVLQDEQGTFVYTLTPAEDPGIGVVTRKQVTTGDLTDQGLEIFAGLADGDRVITAGVTKLSDGMRVKFDHKGA